MEGGVPPSGNKLKSGICRRSLKREGDGGNTDVRVLGKRCGELLLAAVQYHAAKALDGGIVGKLQGDGVASRAIESAALFALFVLGDKNLCLLAGSGGVIGNAHVEIEGA